MKKIHQTLNGGINVGDSDVKHVNKLLQRVLNKQWDTRSAAGNLYYQKIYFWPQILKSAWSHKTYFSFIMNMKQTTVSELGYQRYHYV